MRVPEMQQQMQLVLQASCTQVLTGQVGQTYSTTCHCAPIAHVQRRLCSNTIVQLRRSCRLQLASTVEWKAALELQTEANSVRRTTRRRPSRRTSTGPAHSPALYRLSLRRLRPTSVPRTCTCLPLGLAAGCIKQGRSKIPFLGAFAVTRPTGRRAGHAMRRRKASRGCRRKPTPPSQAKLAAWSDPQSVRFPYETEVKKKLQ